MMRMRNRRIALLLIAVGSILLLAAVSLIGYNIWDDYRVNAEVAGLVEEIPSGAPNADGVPAYLLDPYREMPTAEINGYRYIGRLYIPSLDLELPVMDSWDYKRMKTAPCRYCGSAYLNDLVICGHNYTSHFGRLKNLSAGDAVQFTDMDGNVFSYTIRQMETLSGTAVEEMKSGDWDLTLFTCTWNGRARVTVRCVLNAETEKTQTAQ